MEVSVIIPVYNVDLYLSVCIDSVVNQTFNRNNHMEIILVDDGSTDQCPMICDDYKEKFENVKVIHKVNGGLSDARNSGMMIATGKYFTFIDSDDFITPTMIEKLYKACENEKAEIACCGVFRYYNCDDIKEKPHGKYQVSSKKEAFKKLLNRQDITETAWAKLYKSNIFDSIKYPVGEINEDLSVIGNVLMECNKVVYIGSAEYYYRMRIGSIAQTSYNHKYFVVINNCKKIQKLVTENYYEYADKAKAYTSFWSLMLLFKISECKQDYIEDYHVINRSFKDNYKYLVHASYCNINLKIKASLSYIGIYHGLKFAIKKIIQK